jgi:predicted ATPase/class 3 adenylate cyclase
VLGEAKRTEILRPYLPRVALEWLAESPQERLRTVDGSVVFVDISGFTKMSERLAKLGKVGAEEVTDVIGDVFSQLLATAYANGGGLVKFGGDALLLLYSGSHHETRAVRAAIGMRRTLDHIGNIPTSAGNVRLRMSVGVHSGTFHMFLVGDDHRELIVTGPAASHVVDMEGTADAGEIVVSHETAAAIPQQVLGEPKGAGILLKRQARVPAGIADDESRALPPVASDALERCIPVGLRTHLLSEEGEPEHRRVAIGFVHFDGTDEMLERNGAAAFTDAIDELVRAAQSACGAHGVTFLGSDVDHDGGKIIVVAGAPAATQDDEARLLSALRALADAETTIPLRIGANSGQVFTGDVGPAYRRTYTIMGDAVNLAARVMAKAAPRQLLATKELLDRCPVGFETAALEPFLVKGKKAPVEAAVVGQAVGTGERAEHETPLVGREAEMLLFSERIGEVRAGEGVVLEIAGDPGIGKSRLLDELRGLAADVPVISISCELYSATTPYRPFRALFRGLCDIPPTASADAAGKTLRKVVATRAPHLLPWLPLLGAVTDAAVEPTPEVDDLAEQFRRTKLHEVATTLLFELAPAPVMITLEDVHWMDEGSVALLAHIQGEIEAHPILLAVTRRNEETGFVAAHTPRTTTLAPRPLAHGELKQLIDAVTDERPLRSHDAEIVASRSGGNPLFLQELIKSLGADGSAEALPDSIDAMVLSRIDRLPSLERRVLRYSSILGMSFPQTLAEDLLRTAGVDAPPAVWRNLDEFLLAEDGDRYRFRHALMREAAYEGLPYRRRRALHSAAGDAIIRAVEQPNEVADLLSMHFFHANRHAEAWHFGRMAGDAAREKLATHEATILYMRCLEAGRRAAIPAVELSDVFAKLGDARMKIDEFPASAAAFAEARRLAEGDAVRQAEMLRKAALIPLRTGRYSHATRLVRRALAMIEPDPSMDAKGLRLRLLALLAGIRAHQGKYRDAEAICRQVIDEADEVDEKDALGRAYYLLDFALADQGRMAEATNWRQAASIFENLGDLWSLSEVISNAGADAYERGEWDEALGLYDRARDLRLKIGDVASASACIANAAEILVEQGRLEPADGLVREALRNVRAAEYGPFESFVLCLLGRIEAMWGRFDEATKAFSRGRELAQWAGLRPQVLEIDTRIAEMHMLQGDWGRAAFQVTRTLKEALALDGVYSRVPTLHRLRGECHLHQGDLPRARESFERSLASARERMSSYDEALTVEALARLDQLEGRQPDADALRESHETLERLNVVAPTYDEPARVAL